MYDIAVLLSNLTTFIFFILPHSFVKSHNSFSDISKGRFDIFTVVGLCGCVFCSDSLIYLSFLSVLTDLLSDFL